MVFEESRVLSEAETARRLAERFVSLRMDWEQGNHFRDRLGLMVGSGKQILLDPAGQVLRGWLGRPRVYGRHRRRLAPGVLDRVAAMHPVKSQALRIEWFWWSQRPARRPGGSYPVAADTMAALARLPIAEVQGALPPALESTGFLQRHVRQFIWVRGVEAAASRLVVRRATDGLATGRSTTLATLDPGRLSAAELGDALDAAWREYMMDRPLAARGYLETAGNRLLKRIAGRIVADELEIRRRARDGTLHPPGRAPGLRDA
jgi:hypothetical protein